MAPPAASRCPPASCVAGAERRRLSYRVSRSLTGRVSLSRAVGDGACASNLNSASARESVVDGLAPRRKQVHTNNEVRRAFVHRVRPLTDFQRVLSRPARTRPSRAPAAQRAPRECVGWTPASRACQIVMVPCDELSTVH